MAIEFIAAICPNCGGELRVPEDRKTIKCMYCGYDIFLHETKGDSPHPSIENWLKLAEAVKGANPEEAYGYYQKVLEVEPENWHAWFGKAESINASYIIANSESNLYALLANQRIYEIPNNIKRAIEYCPENEKNKLKDATIIILFKLAMTYRANLLFFSVDNNYDFFSYFDRYKFYFFIIDYILAILPKNSDVYISYAESGLDGCKEVNEKALSEEDYSRWKKQIKDKYQEYINKIKEVDPSYKPKQQTNNPSNSSSNSSKSSSGCFIATATMGSKNNSYVITLCQFRDNVLSKSSQGRKFINLYYKYSPPIAQLIANCNLLKQISRLLIIKPSVFLIKFFYDIG